MSSRGLAEGFGVAEGAMVALTAVLDRATQVGWWQLSDDQLCQAMIMFAGFEARCAAAGVAVLAEAAERGLQFVAGAKRPAEWFRGLVPVTPQVARQCEVLAEAFGTAAHPNP